jgi:CheY-like chemotaxis protein
MMPLTILIIEDDPGAVESFEHMLRHHGYRTRVAGDPQVGWEMLQDQVPAAVLLDLHLPTFSGLEFLRRFRSESPYGAVPVAVVTGDYMIDDHVVTELTALAVRLYFKPLWEEDLIQIVGDLVGAPPEGDPA